MAERPVVGAQVLLVVALVVGVGLTFAPWLHSGSSHRTSYGVVRTADRLGVLGERWDTVVRAGWSFVPFVAALGVVAITVGWLRSAAGLAALVGLVEGFLALAIMASPRSADWGALGGLAVGGVLVVTALVTALGTRSNP